MKNIFSITLENYSFKLRNQAASFLFSSYFMFILHDVSLQKHPLYKRNSLTLNSLKKSGDNASLH